MCITCRITYEIHFFVPINTSRGPHHLELHVELQAESRDFGKDIHHIFLQSDLFGIFQLWLFYCFWLCFGLLPFKIFKSTIIWLAEVLTNTSRKGFFDVELHAGWLFCTYTYAKGPQHIWNYMWNCMENYRTCNHILALTPMPRLPTIFSCVFWCRVIKAAHHILVHI